MGGYYQGSVRIGEGIIAKLGKDRYSEGIGKNFRKLDGCV
jgi:hypothetical protein